MDLDAAVLRDTERKRLRSLVAADMDTADALHAADYELVVAGHHDQSLGVVIVTPC